MRWPWNRIGDELKMELEKVRRDYENYKKETERLIEEYKSRIEELQKENEELKRTLDESIIERCEKDLYEDGMNYGIRLYRKEGESERGFPILDGISPSYTLLQAELFDIWSRIVDAVTNFRILHCEKIERDLGIKLEKVKNAYRIAGDYLKRQFYSPEIYNLVSRLIPYLPSRIAPAPSYYYFPTFYMPYPPSYQKTSYPYYPSNPTKKSDSKIVAKSLDNVRNLAKNLGVKIE